MSGAVPFGEEGITEDTVGAVTCPDVDRCPIRATARALDGKYKAVIIWYLKDGVMRFGEIGRVVPEATPRILSKQLREMELDGLVRKVVYPEVPPRTEYSLTEDGFAIIPVIMTMYEWGISRRGSYGRR